MVLDVMDCTERPQPEYCCGSPRCERFDERDRPLPCCTVYASLRTATEEVIDSLITDAATEKIYVRWRNGEAEPLHRSISVAALADDAVYLEIRRRRAHRRRH